MPGKCWCLLVLVSLDALVCNVFGTKTLEEEFLRIFTTKYVSSPRGTVAIVAEKEAKSITSRIQFPVVIVNSCEEASLQTVRQSRADTCVFISRTFDSSFTFLEKIIADKSFSTVKHWIVMVDQTAGDDQQFEKTPARAALWKLINSLVIVYPSITYRSLSLSRLSLDTESVTLNRVGYFNGQKLNLKEEPFLNSLHSFGHVRVSAFPLSPTTVHCKYDPAQYCGRDIHLIQTLGEYLNFSVVFQETSAKWGDRLANGTWSGMVGDVARSDTNLGVANMFLTQYYLEQVDASYPYDFTCSTFVTPSPRLLPGWMTLIRTFNTELWVISVMVLIVGGLLISLFSRLYAQLLDRPPRNSFENVANAMFHNCEAIMGIGNMYDTSRWPIRLYTSFWWMFCFILTTIYRAELVALLSSPPTEPAIDTLMQLAQSKLQPLVYTQLLAQVADKMHDSHLQKLATKLVIVNNTTTVLEMLEQGEYAFFENRNYLDVLVSRHPSNDYGQSKLRTMKECLLYFPVAIAITPNSHLLKRRIDGTILRLQSAGFLRYWLDYTIWENNRKPHSNARLNAKKPFSLRDLQGAFLALAFGMLASSVAFIGEAVIFRKPVQ